MTYPAGDRPRPLSQEPLPPLPSRAGPTPACAGIIGVCVAIFLLETAGLLPGAGARHVADLQLGALYGPLVRSGQWWRVLGDAFEHGGLVHLGFNMSVVWTLGQALERNVGTGRFLVICLITALGSSLVQLLLAFNVVSVGASGMILGWGGTMLPIATPQGRQSLRVWLIQIAVISLLPGISWQGHVGGLITGGLVAAVYVHAPRARRNLVQASASIGLLVLFVVLIAARTTALVG